MTRNEVITEITTILQANKMIKSVIASPPVNWLFWNEQPEFPNASFDIANGQYNAGRELVYTIEMWLLDKSGVDNEFEYDVSNAMHLVGADVVNVLRQQFKQYSISTSVSWSKVEEKFEDYLTGVTFTFDFIVVNDYTACDVPN
jgi:hypothetical protein